MQSATLCKMKNYATHNIIHEKYKLRKIMQNANIQHMFALRNSHPLACYETTQQASFGNDEVETFSKEE